MDTVDDASVDLLADWQDEPVSPFVSGGDERPADPWRDGPARLEQARPMPALATGPGDEPLPDAVTGQLGGSVTRADRAADESDVDKPGPGRVPPYTGTRTTTTTRGRSSMDTKSLDRGRLWAWAALLFGAAASIGGNIGHTFIPPVGAPVGWSPSPWSLGGAVIAPLFLFIAVKVITLVAWPPGVKWFLWRWVGTSAVIALTGIVSWNHMFGLLTHLGEETYVCWLFPIGIDGLMLVGVGALMASKVPTRLALPRPGSSVVSANGYGLVPARAGR